MIALLERTIKGLRGDLAAEKRARRAADKAAAQAQEELAAMHKWLSARTYDGEPYRGMSLERFREKMEQAQRTPRWQHEVNFYARHGVKIIGADE